MQNDYRPPHLFIISFVCCLFFASIFFAAAASRVVELQEKISSRNSNIEELEKEIKKYETELVGLGKEKATLKNAIRSFDISIKKFGSEIAATQNRITAAVYGIEKLEIDINDKEQKIKRNANAIAQTIRAINAAQSLSLVELVLAHDRLSDVWNDLSNMEQFQIKINRDLAALKELKTGLEENKKLEQQRKGELVNYKEDLNDKKTIVEYNKTEKNKVLRETENKETTFSSLLEEKKQKREQFLAELLELESQLQLEIDPNSLPQPGSKVFIWPLEDVLVTQYFGETEFAKTAHAYKGKGHNGIDLRASTGTKVRASLSGVISGVGNTDIAHGCYSYGKWILLRHYNGLSTLYAHLSIIKVVEGQEVATGETIGFSGNTGYSTGPHLHFTVYATQGVQVQQFSKSINCKNATIPIADLKAYLNPLQYL